MAVNIELSFSLRIRCISDLSGRIPAGETKSLPETLIRKTPFTTHNLKDIIGIFGRGRSQWAEQHSFLIWTLITYLRRTLHHITYELE